MGDSIYVKDIIVQGQLGEVSNYLGREGKPSLIPYIEKRAQTLPDIIKNITALASAANREHKLTQPQGAITRITTDEFSFYPLDGPLTIDEYKKLIDQIGIIAKTLAPNIHLVLATFPVLWPDGGIHNCGLHVCAPNSSGEAPIIHHFSKRKHASFDFAYEQSDSNRYNLTTNEDCTSEQMPDVVLQWTAAKTNDVNQYKGALKLTTAQGKELITTVGICLDHVYGVEHRQTHKLIDQLAANKQSIPITCSHVITSASISEASDKILSTITHADPSSTARTRGHTSHDKHLKPTFPGRRNCSLHSIPETKYTAEIYNVKRLGTLHSDLFDHAVAAVPDLEQQLNKANAQRLTFLHQVFFESDLNRELYARRLYSMIVHGADPMLEDGSGQSAYGYAKQLDAKIDPSNCIITAAIERALQHQEQFLKQNESSYESGYTEMTAYIHRFIASSKKSASTSTMFTLRSDEISFLVRGVQQRFISQGASIYTKNPPGMQSAIDVIREFLGPNSTLENSLMFAATVAAQKFAIDQSVTAAQAWQTPPETTAAVAPIGWPPRNAANNTNTMSNASAAAAAARNTTVVIIPTENQPPPPNLKVKALSEANFSLKEEEIPDPDNNDESGKFSPRG